MYPAWLYLIAHASLGLLGLLTCLGITSLSSIAWIENRLKQLGMEESTPLIEIFRLLKYHHIHMASFHTPNIYIIILIEWS
jgi:hypothetical protein